MTPLPEFFLYVAAALRLFGGLAYFRAIWRGTANPNAITWLLWAITPAITFFAGLSLNVGPSLIVTGALAISPLLVFVAAIIKYPKDIKFDQLNVTCGLLAILGIVLWRLTDHPTLAIALAIVADAISSLPTIIKARRQPFSEHAPTYIMSSSALLLALLTIPRWTFANAAFMIYGFIFNMIIAYFSIFGRLKKLRKNQLIRK